VTVTRLAGLVMVSSNGRGRAVEPEYLKRARFELRV
jgi:hypothetical protein